MSNFDYECWWTLHLRVAKGETLSEQEQDAYDQGLRHLEGDVTPIDAEPLTYLRTLRAAINRASARHAELTAQGLELDQKISTLEATYRRLTGNNLSLETHASS